MTEIESMRPLIAVLVSLAAVIGILGAHRHRDIRESVSIIAAFVKFGVVASMVPGVLDGEVYVSNISTLAPGVDFTLKADPLGMLFAVLASLLWILTTFYSIGYMRSLSESSQTRYFAAFAVSLSATMGIAFSSNLLTLFVFYEVLTIATYPLVAHDETPEARAAGRKYLVYTIGGGVMVFMGTVLVYYLTSLHGEATTDFVSGGIPALIEATQSEPVLAQVAFVLLAWGFAVKAAVIPFHSWLPDAMVAPTPVSGLLHAVAVVKSGAFGVSRVVLDVFGPMGVEETGLGVVLAGFALATFIIASVIALRKDNLKRRLAYSTIAQLSYIVMGVALLSPYAILGGLLHIPAHAFMKLTLFFCAGAIHVETHIDDISDMAGIGKRMPLTMAAFGVAAVGMAGTPLLAGFVSKWYLVAGGFEAGYILFPAALILSGVLNIAYFWPVIYQAFFESEAEHDEKPVVMSDFGGYWGDKPSHYRPEDIMSDGGETERHRFNRVSWFGEESTWFILLPILLTVSGAVLLGVLPDYLFFLEIARSITEAVTGVLL